MLDDPDLHWDDFELLADFFANGVLAAAARTRQLVFREFMNDLDTRQIAGQWLAFAAALARCNNFFIRSLVGRLCQAFCFVKERELGRSRIVGLLCLTAE
ncbi:hypothetical protein D3C80_1597390 [compost metagenome]